MKGFSPRNLKYMRRFSEVWPQREIVQAVLAQLTWYHNIALLEKLPDADQRLWYAQQTLQHGWSRNILALQIEACAIERHGKAQSNFALTLPPPDSDMATQVFKDPYLFDFLGTAGPRREKELEQGLMDHLQEILTEPGQGFAFVGRQVHLESGRRGFLPDLLFYHLKVALRRHRTQGAVVSTRRRRTARHVRDTAVSTVCSTTNDKTSPGVCCWCVRRTSCSLNMRWWHIIQLNQKVQLEQDLTSFCFQEVGSRNFS